MSLLLQLLWALLPPPPPPPGWSVGVATNRGQWRAAEGRERQRMAKRDCDGLVAVAVCGERPLAVGGSSRSRKQATSGDGQRREARGQRNSPGHLGVVRDSMVRACQRLRLAGFFSATRPGLARITRRPRPLLRRVLSPALRSSKRAPPARIAECPPTSSTPAAHLTPLPWPTQPLWPPLRPKKMYLSGRGRWGRGRAVGRGGAVAPRVSASTQRQAATGGEQKRRKHSARNRTAARVSMATGLAPPRAARPPHP